MFDAADPSVFKGSEVSQIWSQVKASTVKFRNLWVPKQPSLELVVTKKIVRMETSDSQNQLKVVIFTLCRFHEQDG